MPTYTSAHTVAIGPEGANRPAVVTVDLVGSLQVRVPPFTVDISIGQGVGDTPDTILVGVWEDIPGAAKIRSAVTAAFPAQED